MLINKVYHGVSLILLAFVSTCGGCSDPGTAPVSQTHGLYRVVYMAQNDKGNEFGIVDELGNDSQLTTATSGEYFSSPHSISPTGGRFAFLSEDALHLYDMKSGTARSVELWSPGFDPTSHGMPSWSPNGARLVIHSYDNNGFAVLDSLGNILHIRYAPPNTQTLSCSWSPISDRIALIAENGVLLVNTNGDVVKQFEGDWHFLQWDLTGESLIVFRSVDRQVIELLAIDVKTGNERLLFTMPKPNGNMAYPRHASNYAVFGYDDHIDRFDLATGAKVTTAARGIVTFAELRSDRNAYVYQARPSSTSDSSDIYVVNVDGTSNVLIKKSGIRPHWTPTTW